MTWIRLGSNGVFCDPSFFLGTEIFEYTNAGSGVKCIRLEQMARCYDPICFFELNFLNKYTYYVSSIQLVSNCAQQHPNTH
jgi:hypothetical protein